MEFRVQLVAILGSLAMLLVVLELVRRRRFLERYALLWLFSGVCLLALFVGLARSRAVPEPGEPAPVAAEHGI